MCYSFIHHSCSPVFWDFHLAFVLSPSALLCIGLAWIYMYLSPLYPNTYPDTSSLSITSCLSFMSSVLQFHSSVSLATAFISFQHLVGLMKYFAVIIPVTDIIIIVSFHFSHSCVPVRSFNTLVSLSNGPSSSLHLVLKGQFPRSLSPLKHRIPRYNYISALFRVLHLSASLPI